MFEISYAAIATPATAPPLRLFPLLEDDTATEAALGADVLDVDVCDATLVPTGAAPVALVFQALLPPLSKLVAGVAGVPPGATVACGKELCTAVPVGSPDGDISPGLSGEHSFLIRHSAPLLALATSPGGIMSA
jgi:hypothetical protein